MNPLRRILSPLVAAVLCSLVGDATRAGDWPQFLGPTRDGVSPETVTHTLPAAGPRIAWRRKIGSGWSAPVVTAGQVLLAHRVGDEELLEAWDAVTGEPRWKVARATRYEDDFSFDNGPRGTPAVSEGAVFTFSAEGRLSRVNLPDGKAPGWSVAAAEALHADKGFFGFASSPLVVSNRVIVQLGGRPGAGIVAFEAATGAVAWKATDDEAGYAAPVLAELGGHPRVVAFNRAGLVVLDPATGAVQRRRAWRSRQNASVNAATPLILEGHLFLTASYDTGAVLLRWTDKDLEPVWSNDDALSSHYATPVRAGDVLIGFHGRQEAGPDLHCVEWRTGRVRWSADRFGAGTVLRAADTLVIVLDTGELVLAAAGADKFTEFARGQILGTGTRAVPALAGGFLYARDKTTLVAVDLRAN